MYDTATNAEKDSSKCMAKAGRVYTKLNNTTIKISSKLNAVCGVKYYGHRGTYSVRYLSADSPTKAPAGGLVCGGAVGGCRSTNEPPTSVSRDPLKPPAELLTRVDLFE